MRPTLRLLANVKPRYLEPFAPTGLTGLITHPSPRPTLIFLYTSTLHKLQSFPESSAYRQSVEALTRHRLQIVESQKPPGFEQWLERVKKTIGAEPERFARLQRSDGSFAFVAKQEMDNSDDARGEEWDGEKLVPGTEGPARTPREAAEWEKIIEESSPTFAKHDAEHHDQTMKWENEPALEAEQYVDTVHFSKRERITDSQNRVSSIEQQIGAGLLEEVIQRAEAEYELVDEMYKSKV